MRFTLAVSISVLAATSCPAADWPQFRGPAASGLTEESKLPAEWGPDQNIAWKIEVPGVAWSQPIVWGDKVFLTTAITEDQQKPTAGGYGGGRGGPPGGFWPRPGGARPPGSGDQPREAGDRPRPEGDRPRAEGDQPRADSERPAGRPEGPRPGSFGGGFRGGPGGFGGGRSAAPPDKLYQWKVICLDRTTGKTLWEKLAKEAKPTIPIHRTNTYASETPVTDGERVYAYFGMTGLYCYDLEGKELWSKEIGSYPMMFGWGTGSSPVLVGDRLILQCDNEEKSFLVAFDKTSGDELWRVEREEKSNWSTPYVWKNKLRTELVTSGKTTRSYDPATGKLLWEFGGNNGGARSSPVGDDDLLYVGTGGGMGGNGPFSAIKAGAEGDVTLEEGETSSDHVAWSVPRAGAPMASPLIYDGCIYILDQRSGLLACYDAKTGDEHYKERIEGARGFTSSPWAYDGKVFCLDESGTTFVLEAGPELNLVGTNKLGEMFWSSPAIANGQLLMRGIDHLFCIE